MWLVNHSFGDGPPVQSQTSMPVNSSPDGPQLFTQPPVCAPPCGPPGGEDAFIAAWTVSSRISQDRLGAPEVGTQHVNSGDCACDLEASSCAPPGPGNLMPHDNEPQDNHPKKKSSSWCSHGWVRASAQVAARAWLCGGVSGSGRVSSLRLEGMAARWG